jgi:AcrR family transcriptional regulator
LSPRPRFDHVRRPEILAAAAQVIRERGLENARVADVADRAGTSAPSVLYYFASKAELLKEALTSAEERFYEELERELERIVGRAAVGPATGSAPRRASRRAASSSR